MVENKNQPAIFRKMMTEDGIVVAPGVFSPVIAQLAKQIGFRSICFSGGGFANLLGLPDLGVTSITEVANAVRYITSITKLPLIVDADTGFGEVVNVMRTIHEMESAGAAAIHIEDQVMPKKCGHLSGKEVVEIDDMAKKIIAGKEARRKDLVLIARTDARAVEGLDSAIERSRVYLRAGADMIFPEALMSKEEFKEFANKVKAPLLANMTEFGKTPYITVAEFQEMGYKVVIFPMTAFRVALKAIHDTFKELKRLGTQKGLLNRMMTRKEIYDLIDYDALESLDQKTLIKAKKLLVSDK
jgi:methylisocitrate lyase